jgi:xanthine dehydrogenase molybdopterin-binding subunit B
MQGVGYHTTEEIEVGSSTSHQWLPAGFVHTATPDTYRVPTMANTPREFNIKLLVRRARLHCCCRHFFV